MIDRHARITAVLRHDFLAFADRVFLEVSPHDTFLENWHHSAIAYELAEIEAGRSTRLIINVPPRSMKSILVSVAWVAWRLGHDPMLRIACVSYNADLSFKLARDSRQVMQSPWFRAVFPDCQLTRVAENDFETTWGGGRFATSTGGAFTGRGADLIILDDPMKPADVNSEVLRKNQVDWLTGTALSRLNQQSKGAFVMVQQRLHEDDLSGRLIEAGGWCCLKLPAIATEDATIPLLYGGMHYRRDGDLLHPERDGRATIERLRLDMGEAVFSAQMQQDPTPAGGLIIKEEWFRYYRPSDVGGAFDYILISWDTAFKTGETNDYSVGTVWGVRNRQIYLIEVVRGRWEFPELEQTVRALAARYPGADILVEDKASGHALIPVLQGHRLPVVAYSPEGTLDKRGRMQAQASLFASGIVLLPEGAAFLPAYRHELLSFPNAKFDDQVDSTSQALAELRKILAEDEVFIIDGEFGVGRRDGWNGQFDYR
jgi:predicted phage terminase large subunit-like protein